ncbi:MAG: tetratricopeptide repeat protein [Deltaproteobacteria bacterium]|nr:MAG: tetratricopeptide repeat protein [Deltaproteobacteria bacterium]
MNLDHLRFEGGKVSIQNFDFFKITGADRERFFQGQVTSDLEKLSPGESQLSARLDRTGKVSSFFHLAKMKDYLILMVDKKLSEITITSFEKFIIMDEVEIEKWDQEPQLVLTPIKLNLEKGEYFSLELFGETGHLYWGENLNKVRVLPFLDLNQDELETIHCISGYPYLEETDSLVNESYLNELAVSYQKGCFLGQETAAKINTFKGAAYFPVLLKVDELLGKDFYHKPFAVEGRKGGVIQSSVSIESENYLRATLFRNFRLEGKKIDLSLEGIILNAEVVFLPYLKKNTRADKALELYHRGVELFQQGDDDMALDLLERSVAIDPTLADAYESLGVILGRLEKYNEAIEWMDRLISVDPTAIMGHTNKSLYLMKLGRIEEAEEEKAKATVKSFESHAKKTEVEKVDQELLRREEMFHQVLELDSEDVIANFGIADISFKRKEFGKAVRHLEVTLKTDPKYSQGYLLLGKCHIEMGEKDKALETLKKGIEIASKKGDMMPANEMQRIFSAL